MPTFEEVLGAEPTGNHAVRFHIPQTLHGAFGGAFGGLLAAACVHTARSVAPDRTPNALDCRFVRGLREPDAIATATVLHAGRSLANVSIDLVDAGGNLCTHATVSLVDEGKLHRSERGERSHDAWKGHADAAPWPPVAPIVTAIDSRIVGQDDGRIATAVVVPWDEPDHGAEAVCVAADMAVGPPLGAAIAGERVSSPNPDLSIRFVGRVSSKIVVGVGAVARATGGVAAVDITTWSDDHLVGVGISTALLLPIG